MSAECEKLAAFADGELEPLEAKRFLEGHLVDCAKCARDLPSILELLAAFDDKAQS